MALSGEPHGGNGNGGSLQYLFTAILADRWMRFWLMMESISIAAFKAQNPEVRLINHQRKSASAVAEPRIMKLLEKIGSSTAIKLMQEFLAKKAR
jgi:hypothetical protein